MTPRKPTRAKALGIDDAEYARLLAAQGGHCALCPNTPKTEHDPKRSWRCRYCALRNEPGTSECEACSRARPKPPGLHVDHDHATGKVRGLLCYVCNKYLPASRDAGWHLRAAGYLGWPDDERDAEITRLVQDDGWTYQRAADRFGVTRQRAWQIVTKAGKA